MAQITSSTNYGSHSYLLNKCIYTTSMRYDLNAWLIWKGAKQMFMS